MPVEENLTISVTITIQFHYTKINIPTTNTKKDIVNCQQHNLLFTM